MDENLLQGDTDDSGWRSHYSFLSVFSISVFLSSFSYSFLTPWLWDYFETTQADGVTQGLVMAANTIGELCGALVFGVLYNQITAKTTLLICMTIGLFGSLVHTSAMLITNHFVPMELLISTRLLQGLWIGGQVTVIQAYVSEVVNDCHKLRVLAELGICSIFGLLSGPAFGMVLETMHVHISQSWPDGLYFPAILHDFCIAGVLAITYFRFKEFPVSFRVPENVPPPTKSGFCVCLFICFCIKTSFAVSEYISKPMLTYNISDVYVHFKWSNEDLYLLLVLALAVSLVAYAFLAAVEGELDDRQILLLALLIAAGGWLLLFDSSGKTIPFTWFILGYMCDLAFSYPVGYNTLVAVVSKLVGPNPAGVYMGVLVGVGALARTIAPYWSFPVLLQSSQLCFGLVCTGLTVAAAALWIGWTQLAPHPINSRVNVISFDELSESERRLPIHPHRSISERSLSRDESEDETYLFASLEQGVLPSARLTK